jgi:hypothetical protein
MNVGMDILATTCSICAPPTPAKSPHEEWHWFLSSASRNRSHKPGIKLNIYP